MDPHSDMEKYEASNVEDDDELEFEDGDELDDIDEDEDDDLEEEDEEAELGSGNGRDTERELDHGLKETFPASDPVSINPGAD
jgi:hypothetical protein